MTNEQLTDKIKLCLEKKDYFSQRIFRISNNAIISLQKEVEHIAKIHSRADYPETLHTDLMKEARSLTQRFLLDLENNERDIIELTQAKTELAMLLEFFPEATEIMEKIIKEKVNK